MNLGKKIFIVLIALAALLVIGIAKKQSEVKPPTYRTEPIQDTTKTKSITDETWFWLLLAS